MSDYDRQVEGKVTELRRPDHEHDYVYTTNRLHRCDPKKWKQDTDDTIDWPVGLVGYMMPGGVEFLVRTACPACGAMLARTFKWQRNLLWTP